MTLCNLNLSNALLYVIMFAMVCHVIVLFYRIEKEKSNKRRVAFIKAHESMTMSGK